MNKFNPTMPRWKASLLSGLVIAAGFYASADLQDRSHKLPATASALETAKRNYRASARSAAKVGGSLRTPVRTNQPGNKE